MSDSFVKVPPDSTGKSVDTKQLNNGSADVQRQVVVMGDHTDFSRCLTVNADGSLNATVSGTFVKAEDSASANGDPGLVILGVRRDSDTPTAGTDGDYTNLKMDEAGRLKVSAAPASQAAVTDTITVNGDTVAIDVSRSSNIMAHCFGTFSTINCTFEGSINSTNGTDGNWFTIQAVRTNANTIETTTGNLSAAPAYGWELSVNGLRWMRVRATAFTSGTQTWVIKPAPYATEPIPAAQVSATQPISGSVTATGVAGAAAHDAAISGNPVRQAGRALTANYTAVATGDVADFVTTLVGAQIIKPFSIPELDWSYAAATGGIINTTAVTIRAAQGAGIRNYITSLQISNNSGTATEVSIRDGAGGTVIWRGMAAANMTQQPITFANPLKSTAATLLEVVCGTTAAAVYVNAQGYSAP
jgi:hypothetical protein